MERHQPVLLPQVIDLLQPQPGETFLDATAGYGGHSLALLQKVEKTGYGYLIDQDPDAIKALRIKFSKHKNVTILEQNFRHITEGEVPKVDMILLDLGVSSPQLDVSQRGFSFQTDGPLDMRMGQSGPTAADLINSLSEAQLATIFWQYGEERSSRRVAHAIVQNRRSQPITTTQQLSKIVGSVIPGHKKIHPATKTFQALRIAVNDELTALSETLPRLTALLLPGGRLAVISFHSLEDRIVKQYFASITDSTRDWRGQIVSSPIFSKVTKKPIQGSQYDINNSRARSAKLRAVRKKI